MRKATQNLRDEHDTILHVFKVMDKVISSTKIQESEKHGIYRDYLYFLRTFVNKCHHAKEEDHLFRTLELAGVQNEDGPIGQMLKEHAQGKEYIIFMGDALEAGDGGRFSIEADRYRELLTSHIKKETGVLFAAADRLLNADEQNRLFRQFEEHEKTVMGNGVHEELLAMIRRWESRV